MGTRRRSHAVRRFIVVPLVSFPAFPAFPARRFITTNVTVKKCRVVHRQRTSNFPPHFNVFRADKRVLGGPRASLVGVFHDAVPEPLQVFGVVVDLIVPMKIGLDQVNHHQLQPNVSRNVPVGVVGGSFRHQQLVHAAQNGGVGGFGRIGFNQYV